MFKPITQFLQRNPCRSFIVPQWFSTIDDTEVDFFKKLSQEWWDLAGPVKLLHSLNRLRVPFIRDTILNTKKVPLKLRNNPVPLQGFHILDVGCGAGLLSEPLARLGGNVTGVDASSELIHYGQIRTKSNNLDNLSYVCSSIEDFSKKHVDKFDAVVSSEVIEHVTEKDIFLDGCIKCLKPGGILVITTISQTLIANFTWIVMAEQVIKNMPRGIHEYNKFIRADILGQMVEKSARIKTQ